MYKVVVDSNGAEALVAKALAAALPAKFELLTAPLDVSDIVIQGPERAFLVERKTLQDFAASVADGRMADQAERMLAAIADARVPTTPVILVAGNPPPHEASVGGMRASALYGMLNRLQFAQGFQVAWCACSVDSVAARVAQIARKLAETNFEPPASVAAKAMRPAGNKRKRSQDPNDPLLCRKAVLMGIPRVSENVAAALLARWPSVRSLAEQPECDIADVNVGKKKLGGALAARIKAALV